MINAPPTKYVGGALLYRPYFGCFEENENLLNIFSIKY